MSVATGTPRGGRIGSARAHSQAGDPDPCHDAPIGTLENPVERGGLRETMTSFEVDGGQSGRDRIRVFRSRP